jgi:hypothetical protein
MDSAHPVADLSRIKAKKEATKAPTNPKTSDDIPLTKGVKRGSVKNLAAMFNNNQKLVGDEGKRMRSMSEGSSKIGATKPGLIKSKSLVFEIDSGSVHTGISTNDLTCSTKYTDNTDRDVDTSIMDDTADSDLFNDKMLIPHSAPNGYHTNKDVLHDGHQRNMMEDEDDFDFQSSESLSRAVSPVLKSRRGCYGFKKRTPKKIESNYSSMFDNKPDFSDTSEESSQIDAPIDVFDKELKRSVAVKPELSTIISQRTTNLSINSSTAGTSAATAIPFTTNTSTTSAVKLVSSTSTQPRTKSKLAGDDFIRQNPVKLKEATAPLTLGEYEQFDFSKPPNFDSDKDLDCSQSSSSSLKENDCLTKVKVGDGTEELKDSHEDSKQIIDENKLTIISDSNSNKIPFSITEYQKMFAKKQESKVSTTPKIRPRFIKQQTVAPPSEFDNVTITTRIPINSTPPTHSATSMTSARNKMQENTTTSTSTKPRGLIKCSSVQSRGSSIKFG